MSTSSSNAHATLEMPPSNLAGMLAERRLEVVVLGDRLVHVPDEVGTSALGRLEQLQSRDVHRVFTGLADEEHRVGRRDQLHGRDGTHTAGDSLTIGKCTSDRHRSYHGHPGDPAKGVGAVCN